MSVHTVKNGRHTVSYAIAILSIIVSLMFCYHKGLAGPFLLDDLGSVKDAVVDTLDIKELIDVSTRDQSGMLGRSLSVFTFAINSYFAGSSTFGYKATNLTIHVLTAMLIGTFLMSVLSRLNRRQQTFTETELKYLALFCTAVWALHPLQVSTVLYVVQRMAMLSTLFTVLALLAFIHLRTGTQSNMRRASLVVAIFFSTVGASLSKENGVLVIPYILLIELTVIHAGVSSSTKSFHHWKIATVTAIIGVSLLLVFLTKYQTALFSGYIVRDYSMWDRLITEPGVLIFYVKLILLPNLADMSLYHDTYPIQRAFNLQIGLQILVWLSFIVAGYILRHRFPVLIFGLGLFLIAHSLESTIFPLELVFEHRNYFGLLGIIVVFCWAILAGFKTIGITRPAFVACIGVLALLGFQTSLRASDWSSAEVFSKQALVKNPDSIRALNGWTTYLASQGEIGLVINHLQKSHRIRPDSPHFLLQLLMFVGATLGPDPALLDYVKNELKTKPLKSEELASLGEVLKYSTEGRFDWPSRFDITQLYKIATEHPHKYLKKIAESYLFRQYSDLLDEAGNTEDALAAIQLSVLLDPKDPKGLVRQAKLQLDTGRLDLATQSLLELDRLDRSEEIKEQRTDLANRIVQRSIAISEMD